MPENAVIFDMDGLLIDSEPLWQEAGIETLSQFGVKLTIEQYHKSTGLRTPEWIDYWFTYFGIDAANAPIAIKNIEAAAMEKIRQRGTPMPGINYVLNFFSQMGYPIGIASSSPTRLIEMVVEKLGIAAHINTISSAEGLAYGKPHPEVFIQSAASLGVPPIRCLVFEDSFNGMIAAKAAKMKCVVVPAPQVFHEQRWSAADLKLGSLANFNNLLLEGMWGR